MKKYQIIYADPPWKYDFHRELKNRPSRKQIVETHYPTMTLDEIKNINIPSEKNSVLFLWVTSPKLKEGMEVLCDWGFNYVTSIIWDKLSMMMGYWLRSQHEIVLIGRKGKFSPPRLQKSSIVKAKRRGHSKKPDEMRSIIEEMFPDASRIELFAREKTEGWDVWGNEVESDIEF